MFTRDCSRRLRKRLCGLIRVKTLPHSWSRADLYYETVESFCFTTSAFSWRKTAALMHCCPHLPVNSRKEAGLSRSVSSSISEEGRGKDTSILLRSSTKNETTRAHLVHADGGPTRPVTGYLNLANVRGYLGVSLAMN